ncbi:MAG: hypothetical protein KJ065_17090 [Anaerolineae bacterium]|nr:hypothetical protein [Anaerolineae bacterium]
MSSNILIVYASTQGGTAEVAAVIGDTLRSEAVAVTIAEAASAPAPDDYSAVIIGSPIYSGDPLPAVVAYVKAHTPALRERPTALFALALRLRDGQDDTRQSVLGTLEQLHIALKPVTIGLFAGALWYDKLGAIARLQAQTKGLPEGDFRDWDAIRAWADEARRVLLPDA